MATGMISRVLLFLVHLSGFFSTASESSLSPRYVLVEEHHHVVSHLVDFSKNGVLRSHMNPKDVEKEVNPNGALLIHIDSHADMGLTSGLINLPTQNLRTQLPSTKNGNYALIGNSLIHIDSHADMGLTSGLINLPTQNLRTQLPSTKNGNYALIGNSLINDFLLLLGYMGIVEHIVFVEPPWSVLLQEAHYTTVDISIGVVPGRNGSVYASIQSSRSSTFERGSVTNAALEAIEAALDDEFEPVEIVAHQELLNHCGRTNGCKIRTVRFTTLPYEGAAHSIKRIIAAEPSDKDIVLDVDLDGFSTTSPGALSLLQTVIPNRDVLTKIFHTVHESAMCDFDASYWDRLISMEHQQSNGKVLCVDHNWSYLKNPFVPPSEIDAIVSETARDFVEELFDSLGHSEVLNEIGWEQLAKVVDYFYVKNMDAAVFDEETFLEVFWSFLIQPYFVPDQEIVRLSMDFHFQVLFQGIFKEKLPKVVNLVRSPYYTPDHHLDFIECEVVDRFFDLFGHTDKSVLYHTAHVDPDRTHCLNGKFLPAWRVDVGAEDNPYIDPDEWRMTSQTFSVFHENDDNFGMAYKHGSIEVTLINEHPFPLVVTFEDGSVLEIPEGKQVDSNTTHLARWDIALKIDGDQKKDEQLLLSRPPFIIFNGKLGPRQIYGSITGLNPVYDITPVKLEITNPVTSGKVVDVRSKDGEINDIDCKSARREPFGAIMGIYGLYTRMVIPTRTIFFGRSLRTRPMGFFIAWNCLSSIMGSIYNAIFSTSCCRRDFSSQMSPYTPPLGNNKSSSGTGSGF